MFGLKLNNCHIIDKIFSKNSVRYITIQQPSTIVTTKPVSLEEPKNQDDAANLPIIDSEKAEKIDSPSFKTIGTPASSLSVTIPPSIPINVKKGSIISVYSFIQNKEKDNENNNNNNNNNKLFIKSKWELKQPLRRLWFSGKVSSYQNIIGTVPLQILVSAYDGFEGNKVSGVKSFVNLTLDGTVDWTLFKPNSLQCYTGNSLNVKIKSLPKNLHYGFTGRGYTWINGRGLVSIVGNGSIFKVGLGKGEEIRVGRDNILAMSINDISDLFNSISSEIWNSADGLFHQKNKKKTDAIVENLKSKSFVLTRNRFLDGVLSSIWEFSKSFIDILKTSKNQLTDYVLGNGHYVVIRGPRTVLIETGSGKDKFVVNANEIFGFNNKKGLITELEESIKNENEWKKPKSSIGDNIGVVTINKGEAVYKNVDNFNEEVTRIENLKNKKND